MTVRPLARILALAAGLVAAPLAATSFVRVADEALADQAAVTAVVRVESADREAGAREGSAIATEYTVRVEKVLAGQPSGKILRVRVPGGVGPGGLALEIHGAPRFRPGERALLFLEPDRGGAYRPLHLFLGAFHEVEAGGRRLAVRDLSGASEVRVTPEGAPQALPPAPERPRDFDRFARWIADRAAGRPRPADYLTAGPAKFSVFADPKDHLNLRWFVFDTGGAVEWRALETGQEGIADGGYAELQAALRVWNDEPGTPIDYRWAGTTAATAGLGRADGVNSVVFNDPAGFVPPFNCATGGILAIGGPWYELAATLRDGKPFHRIPEADVVVNNGLACLFARSASPVRLAEELLAHELGHTLGLGHSCGDSATPGCAGNPTLDRALMRAFIHDDGRGAWLEADDQAGLRMLYASGPLPAAPTQLTAEVLSPVEVQLFWKDVATDETEYRVEVRTVDSAFADVGSVPANSISAIVQGLAPATRYVFRVRAGRQGVFSPYSNEVEAVTGDAALPCAADAATVCLKDRRFRVRVSWAAPDGRAGVALGTPFLAGDSGLFWFFAPDNLELLVKVIDACANNGRYWLFAGPATNLQYVLTVTDTRTGKVRVYFHPQGASPLAVTDTEAFDCP